MSFVAVKFPSLKLKHGNSTSYVNPITVTGNGAREVRRKQYRWDRRIVNIPSRQLLETDIENLTKFYHTVEGGLKSFLYQDPTFPEFNGHPLSNRSGSTWYLNVPFNSTTPGTHPILNPQMGELTFKVNGSTVSATFGIDTDGFPYVTLPGSSVGSSITVFGPIYLTMRFEGDISNTITAMQKSTLGGTCNVVPYAQSISDITLIEVFEV